MDNYASVRERELTQRLHADAESGQVPAKSTKLSSAMHVRGRRRLFMTISLASLCMLSVLFRWGLLSTRRSTASDGAQSPTKADSLYVSQLPAPVREADCPDGMACFQKAAYLSPSSLLAAPPSNGTAVPRLLHQSWGEDLLPARVLRWSEQCRMLHPNWQWVLWKDNDNRELVKQRFPWFLDTYDGLDSSIKRADAARNLYMHAFGGVYLDFDVECVRPFDQLVHSEGEATLRAVFGWMGSDRSHPHSIPNDWMASSAGHPFFLLPLSVILHSKEHRLLKPEDETGPVPLRTQILRYKADFEDEQEDLDSYLRSSLPSSLFRTQAPRHPATLTILDEHIIHPFSWTLGSHNTQGKRCLAYLHTFDPEACKELLRVQEKGTHAVAYWTHSWESVAELNYR